MIRIARWISSFSGLIAAAVLLSAPPARASDFQSLEHDAVSEFNAAVRAEQAGQNQTACRRYRNAAGLFENAIYSLLSVPMTTETARENVKDAAAQVQQRVHLAKANAKSVCNLPDGPGPASTGSSSNDGETNFTAQEDLQQTATNAKVQYAEAIRLYEARDFAGSCTSARLSAASFARVAAALKANPALESAFANPAQLYANAAQTAEDRDTFYCKG